MTGISIAPSARATVGSVIPARAATAVAPASSASQMVVCQVLATIPSRSPAASNSGRSGTPAPPLIGGAPLPSQRPAQIAGQRQVFAVVEPGQVVTHPVALGFQVADVLGVGPHRQRYALEDVQPVAVQADPRGGVVGEQPHRAHAQGDEDLRTGAVGTGPGGRAPPETGGGRVVGGVLLLGALQLATH